MLKVHILTICSHCNGEAYQPMGETEDYQGHKYTRYVPCLFCEGSGNESRWVDIQDFSKLIQQAVCPHKHATYRGGMHFSAGDVWDDIQEVCDDCGVNLDHPTLGEFIQDES